MTKIPTTSCCHSWRWSQKIPLIPACKGGYSGGQHAGPLLNAFGAVADGPEITPLGRWAMERPADSQPVMPEKLITAEMLARLAMFDQAQRRDLAWAAEADGRRGRWRAGWYRVGFQIEE
jgi:hypothetical protein